MKHRFNPDVKSTMDVVELNGNDVLVERAGYAPLKVQVDRAFSAGAIATMAQKMADPNGQYDRIIEDATAIEENFKDNLTLLAYAKQVKERCQGQIDAYNAQVVDANRQKLADADAIIKEKQSNPTDIVG